MSDSLRRSTRRNTRNSPVYNVGDLVEVAKNDSVVRGRLVQKLTESPASNPRWLVAFDDNPAWKNEELYEKDLGKQLPKSRDTPVLKSARFRNRSRSNPTRRRNGKSGSNSKTSSSSEAEETRSTLNAKKKVVTFTNDSADASEVDQPSEMGKSSAREQRSLRRQAKVEEEVVLHPSTQSSLTKRPRAPISTPGSVSKKSRTEQEVVKVPLLTGTLYLYRGPVRRAEFVRRF
mmetsp:Transcript_21973/g.32454  ORF Transcript_21973/g.32454 Transcript_21973/m.32454 type:complete len:232 (+) Transcript_21973:88-783(+)|eukprot:CAMPEP_0194200308 /NCGR_PEP_ID=MMETSP0156-20130528/970_1 /TAXON_ID=33649 /ORGANISM="Thalassionema nitzschioides, Strain L26-B" /LENGTH=231 /DNA_ID=CAMNT_0038925285 /DNA_START=52 /DNA_END=747 /DNA_ORIENTATION=+